MISTEERKRKDMKKKILSCGNLCNQVVKKGGIINMMETVLKVKVDEFLAHKIGDIVKKGAFKSEDEFLKSAVEDMVRRWGIRELNTKMDKFAERIAKKHPESISEAVLKAREEEDEIL